MRVKCLSLLSIVVVQVSFYMTKDDLSAMAMVMVDMLS